MSKIAFSMRDQMDSSQRSSALRVETGLRRCNWLSLNRAPKAAIPETQIFHPFQRRDQTL